MRCPSLVSITLSCAASSFATYTSLPSGLTATCSGSGPEGSTLINLRWRTSTTPMPSALRSGGGSFDSSTFGPPIGEPLNATYSSVRSGLATMPRGRLPSGMVATTVLLAASMTERSPPVSLVTYTPTAGGAGGGDGAAEGVGDAAGGSERPHATIPPRSTEATTARQVFMAPIIVMPGRDADYHSRIVEET